MVSAAHSGVFRSVGAASSATSGATPASAMAAALGGDSCARLASAPAADSAARSSAGRRAMSPTSAAIPPEPATAALTPADNGYPLMSAEVRVEFVRQGAMR